MEDQKLLRLIKCILNQQTDSELSVAEDEWTKIIALAQRHKLTYILAYSLPYLSAEQMPGEKEKSDMQKATAAASVMGSNQLYAAEQLLQAFEQQGVWNLALKGIATKQLYPQRELRYMNDLDILCKPNHQKMVRRIAEELGFMDFQEGRKHDSYTKPPFVRLELHREMVAARSPFSRYYRDIWRMCSPQKGSCYTCRLSVTDDFVYNLVHLAEHLQEGGVGIRFIMDVYVYDNCLEVDRQHLQQELDKLGLWEMYQNISCLAQRWFAPQPQALEQTREALMDRLGAFVLSGGLFGSKADSQALQVQKEGRFRFLLKACFPDYGEMRSMYPWLERWPVLLPWSWLLRGVCSLLYRRGNIEAQFRVWKNGNMDRGEEIRRLYRDIGFNK